MMLTTWATERPHWDVCVRRCRRHDVYHTYEWHRLHCPAGYVPHLFHFNLGVRVAAIPLLLSDTHTPKATSIYGYPGPLCSDLDPPTEFINAFWSELRVALRAKQIASVETRLNPMLTAADKLLVGANFRPVGATVVIDLANYRPSKGHRAEIGRSRANGVVALHDLVWATAPIFGPMYEATMLRAGAAPQYMHLPIAELGENLPDAHLFIALDVFKVIGGAIFLRTGGIVQYHLAATIPDDPRGAKVLIDEAVQFFGTRGCKWLHLGGGLGSDPGDPLFIFKKGFSKLRLPFQVAEWEV